MDPGVPLKSRAGVPRPRVAKVRSWRGLQPACQPPPLRAHRSPGQLLLQSLLLLGLRSGDSGTFPSHLKKKVSTLQGVFLPNNVENPPSSSLACTSTARSAGARQLPLIAPLLLRPVVTAVLAATDWDGWAPPAKYQPSSTRHTRLPHTLAGPALEFPASQLRESRHSLRGQPTQQIKWNKGFLFCFNNGFFSLEKN